MLIGLLPAREVEDILSVSLSEVVTVQAVPDGRREGVVYLVLLKEDCQQGPLGDDAPCAVCSVQM